MKLGLGYDEGTLSESYGKQADQVLREYQLMASLSHPNVVACRDVAKVSHAGDPGCDVLIRMELLTPLPRWLRGRDADPREPLGICGRPHPPQCGRGREVFLLG